MGIPFASAYTVSTYPSSGYDASGRATEGSPTTASVLMTVTPVSLRTARQLQEGKRKGAQYSIRTEVDLGTETSGQSVRVTIGGREHEIEAFGDWSPSTFGSLRHRHYVAREIES